MEIHELELLLIALLAVVIGFGALAKKIGQPYPIVLVVAGLLIGLAPQAPRFALNPDLVFLAFLPPLLFAAAFTTSWREFKYNLVSISFLAFGLVAFTVLGVALGAGWILPGFDWRLGLVLGAVVSTTDAIAASSIARSVGLPSRIVEVLEGESLLNDASGLLALEFSVALVVTGQHHTAAAEFGRLLFLVAGGIGAGLVTGWLMHWLENHIEDAPVEITMSLVAPYVAYLAAESVHASGVLSTVACGLYLGRHSTHFFSSAVRVEASAFWNTLTFILNGVVFALIGLQLPYILASIRGMNLADLLLRGAGFSALVILLRLVWIYPGAYASYWVRRKFQHQREDTPSKEGMFVVGWTGMRGVVALAAAISLPERLANGQPFPNRSVIIFMTFCVIFATLILQGLTLPALIRKLGLANQAVGRPCEEKEARRLMLEAALEKLGDLRDRNKEIGEEVYNDLANAYRWRLAGVNEEDKDGGRKEQHREAGNWLRDAERQKLLELQAQNRIGDDLVRVLQREIDLAELRFQR